MPPSPLQHRRTQNTLLFQKLLNLRDGASPFTLILDSLEKGGKIVLEEFMGRAKISKTKVIFVSFRALRKPKLADVFIAARGKGLKNLRSEISSSIPSTSTTPGQRALLIIDTLNPLCNSSASILPAFLSSLLSPTVSMIGIYHTDIPVSHSKTLASNYNAHPLTTLIYLATSILTLHSLSQTVAKKAARDRSLLEPSFGLAEDREGLLVSLSRPKPKFLCRDAIEEIMEDSGVVMEMEIRRKSGRGVRDVFVLIPGANIATASTTGVQPGNPISTKIILLDDHPSYAQQPLSSPVQQSLETENDVTFSLSLTEKQKRDREGIVLPYFDAQKDEFVGSAGEGGRILYDMGREDDFDEEEDEI